MEFGITRLASETAASGGILDTLGVDVKLLAFQIIAFLLLVFALSKWVFPVFISIIDKRQAAIEESSKAALEASKHAEKAEAQVSAMLKEARMEAQSIVSTAKSEATDMLARSESKAKAHAEAIVESAKADINKEIVAAKKALHNETLELVALATEKVARQKVTEASDKTLIKNALEQVA